MLDFLLQSEVSSAAKENTLGVAAEGGHLDVVDRLLAKEAKVNTTTANSSRTAL